jgi:hypothetical protein
MAGLGCFEAMPEKDVKNMRGVFELWAIVDKNPERKPHYPRYKVEWEKFASASTLELAEKIMADHIRKSRESVPESIRDSSLHHYSIRQVPLDDLSYMRCLSERIYDGDGNLVDERTISTRDVDNEIFKGRTPEQIRFKEGDIVEVMGNGEIQLGFVVGLPASVEEASKINDNALFSLDASDDSYTVLFDSSYYSHSHVDALCIFKPQFRVHPNIERRLRKAYNDFRTFPARQKIANATAEARLKAILEELGIEGKMILPRHESDDFILILAIDGGSRVVLIEDKKVYDHLERVRITLFRLAGKPVSGRGYGIHKNDFGALKIR